MFWRSPLIASINFLKDKSSKGIEPISPCLEVSFKFPWQSEPALINKLFSLANF